jgi:hypothetical protein
MTDEEFQKALDLAEARENKVAAALARQHGWGLLFAEEKQRKYFDYVLFDHSLGLSLRVEQKNSHQSDFCIELDQGDQPGVLSVCRADRFLWHDEVEKKIYIFNWPELKAYICDLQSQGRLDIRDYRNKPEEWNHPTSPTRFCILKKLETIEAMKDNLTVYKERELNL